MNDKRGEKVLQLHVNSAPFSGPGFEARVSRCIAEMRPVIDRLCNRHGTMTVFAALLSECEDATLGAALNRRIDGRAAAHIFKRLHAAIERAGSAGLEGDDAHKNQP